MKNLKETILKTRSVALYASLTIDDFVCVWEMRYNDYDEHYQPLPTGERREVPHAGYVRISEPMELKFAPIDKDEIVRNAVSSIDEEERKLRSELHGKIAQLQERRNQLLALTYQPEEAA